MNAKPNFSEVWEVDFERSHLEIPPPNSTVFVIKHEEPCLALKRTHVAEAYHDTFSIDLSIDGREVVSQKGEAEIRSTCEWQGSSLRFRSEIYANGAKAENLVVYTLSEDRQEIRADERFTSVPESYHNNWVLVRQQLTTGGA